MEPPETGKEQPVPVSGKRIRFKVFLSLVLLLVIGTGIFAVVIHRNGVKTARNYLQSRIFRLSDSVYSADFRNIRVDLFAGKIIIDSFELRPDSVRYARLKQEGKTARALYQISFESLTIDKVHFWKILTGKRINFRQLTIQKPGINILGLPDTSTTGHQRWRVFYEDIYPTVSSLVRDFNIDSVKVYDGLFTTSFRQKTGRSAEGEYQFTATLKDVAINPFSYYNPDRVFYSRDVDLVIHNFDYQMADSLYTLKADEIGFSLNRSVLHGKEISLVPDFRRAGRGKAAAGDLYRFDLPYFSIGGIDLYKVLTGRVVDLDTVQFDQLGIRVYHHSGGEKPKESILSHGRLDLSGLYQLVSRELKYIRISKVRLSNGAFSYYRSYFDRQPEVRIGRAGVLLSDFLIDSLSHRDMERLFFARELELEVEDFSLALRDGIHHIMASGVLFSTSRSVIDVNHCLIFPDRKKNDRDPAARLNYLDIRVPHLLFSGIDLKKVFHRRVFDFDRLVIHEPDMLFMQLNSRRNPDPRFRKAEDFFEEENQGVVFNLIKRYLWAVKGNSIGIEHGFVTYAYDMTELHKPNVSAHVNLEMYHFLIDSVHGMNRKGYFYSDDFDLTLQSASIVSPDSTRQFRAEMIRVKTTDSLIEARNIEIVRAPAPHRGPRQIGKASLRASFRLKKLYLTGLNHRKLFLEKKLKASEIVLDDPEVALHSFHRHGARLPLQQSDSVYRPEYIRSFELGRCVVRGGVFSYTGQEDRLASYFSLKEIGFSMVNADIVLPGKDEREGSIRFDSFRLKVFPLRAILADSSYSLEAGSLSLGSYPMDIHLQDIRIAPLASGGTKSNDLSHLDLKIPEFNVHGFRFDRAIFSREWLLDSISVIHPSLAGRITPREDAGERFRFPDPDNLFPLPVFIKSLGVGQMRIEDATVQLSVGRGDSLEQFRTGNIRLNISGFNMDTASTGGGRGNLYHADDIRLSVPGFRSVSRDSLYTRSTGPLHLSTREGVLQVDTFRLIPNFDPDQFSARCGRQVTRLDLLAPGIRLEGIDFRAFLLHRRFEADQVIIDRPVLHARLDKRIPRREIRKIPLPSHLLLSDIPLSVGRVKIREGKIVYEEQVGVLPGKLWFDQADATISGISMPVSLSGAATQVHIDGNAMLMGRGSTEIHITMFPGHPRDSFLLTGKVSAMQLSDLNPMLTRLVPVSVRRGVLDTLVLNAFRANDHEATGYLTFSYHDLQVRFLPETRDLWERISKGLMTEAANLLLPLSNPSGNGILKKGYIYHERDTSRAVFNFIWKGTLSGIRSTLGINNDEQKQMIRSERGRSK